MAEGAGGGMEGVSTMESKPAAGDGAKGDSPATGRRLESEEAIIWSIERGEYGPVGGDFESYGAVV